VKTASVKSAVVCGSKRFKRGITRKKLCQFREVLPRVAFSGMAVTLTGNYRTARYSDRTTITSHKAELTDWPSHSG